MISLLNKNSQKRRYDLPLHSDESTGFLIILIALMTFLSAIILSFSFSIHHIMEGWSNGLENKLSIEIPLNDENKQPRSKSAILDIQTRLIKNLSQFDGITHVEAVQQSDLRAIISTWLGNNSFADNLPLPALLSVHLDNDKTDIYPAIKKIVHSIDNLTIIDTHETWLNDLLKITSSLQNIVGIIVLIIATTTVVAVAGAIKSQIEIHRSDVELLHLMGASDVYISNQFTRHASILSSLGSFLGLTLGLIAIFTLSGLLKDSNQILLPKVLFHWHELFILICIPAIISIISAMSARLTVYRVLERMP